MTEGTRTRLINEFYDGIAEKDWAEWAIEAVDLLEGPGKPIDMVLHCPACRMQHIDGPGNHTRRCNTDHPPADAQPWTNPPHRSHLCHACGYIWRPADVATNGVADIKTRGKNDSARIMARWTGLEGRHE